MKGSYHSYSCDTKDRYLIHVYLVLFSVGLTYLLHVLFNVIDNEMPWWLGIPGIISIYGVLYFVFSSCLWKVTFFRFILQIKTPIIKGIYSGTLKSSYDNFKSEKKVNLNIDQKWAKINISLSTESSHSFSRSCSILVQNQASPIINYLYQNDPKYDSVETMQIHYGMCQLFIDDKGLSGEFFSGRSRKTFGTINTEKQQ